MIAERLLARLIGAFVLLNLLPAAAWADDLDRLLETGVVRVAVPQDLPPFGSIVEGAPRGYDVDVARLLAADLGARLELVAVTSPNRIAALLTQRADLGITPSFSTPYAAFFSAVFGAPDLAVKGPADLLGRKTAVTRDTIEDGELARIAPQGAEIARFDDNDATMSAFLSGKADVIAAVLKQHPERRIESKFLIKESPAAIGVRHQEPELLNWVNVFVFHKKLSGDLDRLSRQWFGEPLRPLPVL
jgi:polar amino acid transport system substrate-binding protein